MKSTYLALGLLFIALFTGGCITAPPDVEGKTPTAGVEDTTITDETKDVKDVPEIEIPEETFEPIKLVYKMEKMQFGDSNEAEFTMWVEEKNDCNGREAYLGVVKTSYGKDEGGYAKFTIYADNGELVLTETRGINDIAFDMRAKFLEFDFLMPLNTMFLHAGENFNTDEIWTSKTVKILQNVNDGKSIQNYSIFKQNIIDSNELPCRMFKVATKGTNMESTFLICVTEINEETPLPFLVSFDFDSTDLPQDLVDTLPNWNLIGFTRGEKSNLAWVPQCLTPVKCTYVPYPSGEERDLCDSKGGQIEPITDEIGCVLEYECYVRR